MGRNHARVLGSLDGVELVGVADPAGDPHRRGRRACRSLASVEELIALGIDYAVVAVPDRAATRRSAWSWPPPACTR